MFFQARSSKFPDREKDQVPVQDRIPVLDLVPVLASDIDSWFLVAGRQRQHVQRMHEQYKKDNICLRAEMHQHVILPRRLPRTEHEANPEESVLGTGAKDMRISFSVLEPWQTP